MNLTKKPTLLTRKTTFAIVLLRAITVSLCLTCNCLAVPLSDESIENQLRVSEKLQEQIAQIEAIFEDTGELNTYEEEFKKALTERKASPLTEKLLFERIGDTPYVFVADVHTSRETQTLIIEVMRQMSGASPVTVVLEFIDRQFQHEVDDYLAGNIDLETLRVSICYEQYWNFSWDSYCRILEEARNLSFFVLLTENLEEENDLYVRDVMVSSAIGAHRNANPGMHYLVPYGTYHLLGNNHLTERLTQQGLAPQLIVVDEADIHYWNTLKVVKDPELIKAMDLGDNLYYIQRDSPIERLKAYRAYLMTVTGWMEEDFTEPLDSIMAQLKERRSIFGRIHDFPPAISPSACK
jgi:hypothetical protein